MSAERAQRIGRRPVLYRAEGMLTPHELSHLSALVRDEDELARRGVSTLRQPTGTSCELLVAGDTVLEGIAARVLAWVGDPDAELSSLRYRRYLPGQGHPPHCDDYAIDGKRLVATVLLGLEMPGAGGATRFPRAEPEPQALVLAPGDAALWFNLDADGLVDPAALHDGAPVEAGIKAILGCFIYASLATFTSPLADPTEEQRGRLYCIVDDTPASTVRQLEEACEQRGVAFVRIEAQAFDHAGWEPLEPGAMLYCPAISRAASVVELLLVHERVATFYKHPLGPHLGWDLQSLFLARQGVPVPRTIYAVPRDRAALRRYVAALGGFPVILKAPGYSLGMGVMRLESWPALFSVVDFLVGAQGVRVSLMSCVEPALHWRAIVVGSRVVACYRNTIDQDDFRTHVEERREDFSVEAPPEVGEVAIHAVGLLGLEFGGVDLLEHESGRVYLLEVNFPCYFGHPHEIAGIDVAGAMVEHLMSKAIALRP